MPKHATGWHSAPGLASSNAEGSTMAAGSVKPVAVPSTCAAPCGEQTSNLNPHHMGFKVFRASNPSLVDSTMPDASMKHEALGLAKEASLHLPRSLSE